jgi:hypothetical protein
MHGSGTGLDTRKIDKNIERLKQEVWFKRIYEDERYRRLFFSNKYVRAYLQSNYRVNKMIRYERAQKRFLNVLDYQLKR